MRNTYNVENNKKGGLSIVLVHYNKLRQEQVVHLIWDKSGRFEGIAISHLYLAALVENKLTQHIASLPLDIAIGACEKMVQSWGFVKDESYGKGS